MKNLAVQKITNSPRFLKEIAATEITHLVASSNYTFVMLKSGGKIVSGYSLKIFNEFFGEESFLRVDRSNLVNRSFIKKLIYGEHADFIRLKDNVEIKVPRRKREKLIAMVFAK